MNRLVDNAIALRIVRMLMQPFTDTEAYHLGIIDAKGNTIRKSKDLHTEAEKNAYNYLTRLVFGLKKIINTFGGDSKVKSLVAALWLAREQYENHNKLTKSELQEKFVEIMKMMENRVSLVEEEIIVKKALDEDGGVGVGAIGGGAPANHTGTAVSTDQPKIYKKDIKKYHNNQSGVIAGMARRAKPVMK